MLKAYNFYLLTIEDRTLRCAWFSDFNVIDDWTNFHDYYSKVHKFFIIAEPMFDLNQTNQDKNALITSHHLVGRIKGIFP